MSASHSSIETDLSAWLRSELSRQPIKDASASTLNVDDLQLQPLSGDAGMRRYFQIDGLDTCLAVYAPPETENSSSFVAIAGFLRRQGVRAPRIYAADFHRGFLLIENLGSQLLLSALNVDSVDNFYRQCLNILINMQQSEVPDTLLSDYDEEKLLQEMRLFPQWFIEQLLAYRLNAKETALLERVFEQLVASALEQPQAFVHRDYHCRNLVLRDGPPGVIDFQDAVIGPVTYDVVSLLKDCYIRWPVEKVEGWLMDYAHMAAQANVTGEVTAEQLKRWFDWMGLQRHLKVLGIFSRLYLRDDKPSYLHDLPLVIRYVIEVLERYPEFDALATWFKHSLLPLAQRQNWYEDYLTAGESGREG